jgi:hypothetical protein
MYVEGFLHKTLLPVMHKKRLITLTAFVSTVLRSKKLSLSSLGREVDLPIQERSGIRRADRCLGNKKLHQERHRIHQIIISRAIGSTGRPDIIVDWSSIPNTTHHTLRAALVAQGRAITLYEEVHVENKLGTQEVHNNFLHTLKMLLPIECRPIIITDAGFYNGWFKQILKIGWDFIGRVRGKKYFRNKGEEEWRFSKSLFSQATDTPQNLGEVELCKANTLNVRLCIYKGKYLKKPRTKRSGRKPTEYREAAKEPWVLATSLSESYFLAKKITIKYSKRMQIEEGFRDLKSSQYGFGLEKAHSKAPARIEVLLLIAMLASFLAWLTGWIAEKNGLHLQFQSNSVKNRRILSLFFLGCQIIKKRIAIPINLLEAATHQALG